MIDIILENNLCQAQIITQGAELKSFKNKTTGIEHIWNSNPQFWGKSSPILFPIVGGLKNGRYTYKEKEYSLGRHGFARDLNFEIIEHSSNSCSLKLCSNQNTLIHYPFNFELIASYQLINNSLTCNYLVKNIDDNLMYFSIGAHPAFAVPFNNNETYSDYYIDFNAKQNTPLYTLTTDGLIKREPMPYLQNESNIAINYELFYKDALVFKNLETSRISIKSYQHSHALHFDFEGYEYFGIRAAKNANFVCLEPWCGIADFEDATGDITTKDGIITLPPNEKFNRSWKITVE